MINLDHNASTPTLPQIWDQVRELQDELSYNPESQHEAGFRAKKILNKSRQAILDLVGTPDNYAIFTSGATEANGIALLSYKKNGYHIIAPATEHKSVLYYADTVCPVHQSGRPDLEFLKKTLMSTYAPAVFACMYANNETGIISDPEGNLAELCQITGTLLHVDASQCYGKDRTLPEFITQNADSIVLSGHKMKAFKGTGVLLFKPDLSSIMESPFLGGSQEYGIRPGTVNLPGIYSMGLAAKYITHHSFKDKIDIITSSLADLCQINGDGPRLPNTISLRFPQILSELLISKLSDSGFMVSGMSACDSGIATTSHVISAMYPNTGYDQHTIRVSLGAETSTDDVCRFTRAVRSVVKSAEAEGPLTTLEESRSGVALRS